MQGKVDLNVVDAKQPYEAMDLELQVQHPDLQCLIHMVTKFAISPTESSNDFGNREEQEMEVCGISSQDNFTLNWVYLIVTLLIMGLSEAYRQAVLNKYSGYDMVLTELRAYLCNL